MNVVIYARFSSHSQTEQSIEGQLKVCYEYAEANHYTVVGEYIDRAISGTTDNRAEFQRMISDSDKHTFEGVLVYQLDRFARNRYDSAINKAKLKKNGVRVLSAKENIADDASGILVEGVLESMAEYYSVELSQKIHRGMAINAEKCLSNGSNPGLGIKVDAERRFYVDEEEAAIVREIYERYASGETKAEIIRDLKRRRVKTSLGKEFSPNSLSHLLSNKRYIGVYLYKGKETPGGMPRILDDDLFYRVQSMMNKNKNAPARTHGEGEYLLTTKLFCGHCKEMMVGYGGTSKTGRQYHYYMCKNARRKKCGKKIVSKSYIEDRVVNECLKMLTEEKIRFIAKKVAEECAKSPDNLTSKALKKAIREADTAIENLWKAIERGRAVEMLTDRLNKRMAEKAELEAQLAVEENKKITLTEAQILAFLDYVCEMPADDVNKRRAIINIFVHSIYLYDDHFTLIINASKKPLSIDNIPLDDIETAFEGETGASEGCSSLSTPAPPIIKGVETSSDLTERKREDRPSVSPIRYSATDTKKEAAMHNGSLLIDMHVHLARYEVLSASTRDWFISLYPSEAAYQAVCEANASPDDFCAMLAEKGVDYAVILAEDTPAVTGVADNRMVADFCKGHPQLLPFCTFDPLKEKDMPGQLRQLAAEGFRGVKLYPTYNFFYPNAPMMYPLYETAQELGLPVMFHTGLSVFKSSRLKYGSPIFYDDIAVDFPELKIVMCHGGRDCWYREAFTVARLHKNVYIDVAGLPPKKLLTYFPDLPRLARKFVFGTDWPSVDIGKNADAIAQLPLPEEDIRAILGETAKRLLGV